MRAEEESEMTKRIDITPAPEPLEAYTKQFDDLFEKSNQREGFRRYLEGLLLPTERHKTLTGLVNTEPVVGAQLPRAQRLQWFLSESTWDERRVQAERLSLLREDPATAPTSDGVLVIDETGDRKDGHHTAHVGRQYLANLGKIDNGVVSVTSLWADEGVYYPVDFEPYTPAHHFEKGKKDPQFRTKLKIAVELVRRAVQANIPFRAVVADSFYGEDDGVKQGLRALGVGYVVALKPSHSWWHPIRAIGSLQEAARAGRWKSPERPGKWVKVTRTFRDGSKEDWWALEVVTGPYGPDKPQRVVIATTNPLTLPDLTTFYLVTNLPAPGSQRAEVSPLAAASLEEVVRLYGLRMWVEQSYKQVKHALGWSQYQVRSDRAMRRHWQLVCCAFSFCWYHASHAEARTAHKPLEASEPPVGTPEGVPADEAGTGKKNQRGKRRSTAGVLADGAAGSTRMVGALDHAAALLAWLVASAPTSCVTVPAQLA
jgi:SRSO17 transposase